MASRSKVPSPAEYRRHNAAVETRIAEHFRNVHVPGPRVDLPGQLELPQTEERLGNLAKRTAAEPMRPKAPQKPCDVGLFSDVAAQIDLEDLTRGNHHD